jgi:transcriptional antiterminator NusG
MSEDENLEETAEGKEPTTVEQETTNSTSEVDSDASSPVLEREETEEQSEVEIEPKPKVEARMEFEPEKTQIFALKTTANQEVNVANLIAQRASVAKAPIYSVLVSGTLKGYIFVEAAGPHYVDDIASAVKNAKQRIPGLVKLSELERYLVTKPVIEELEVNDTVEIIGGPLKGMRAKITKADKSKNEVTLELLEATMTLPITVHGDYVRLVGKGEKES